jgi:2-furoyl-CoA dehydrogenase large subunit
VTLSELVEPERATLSGGVIGPLGASEGTGHVTLRAEGAGTRVNYDYAIELTGTVASVGGRLLEGAAKAVVNQFFVRLVAQVGGEAGAKPAESWLRRLLRSLGF